MLFGVAAALRAHVLNFKATANAGDGLRESLDSFRGRIFHDSGFCFQNHASGFTDGGGKYRPAAGHVHEDL